MESVDMAYSVLMSVYAREKAEYLSKSIDSILIQTAPPIDFVLVCDGALNESLESVIEEKVKGNPGLFQIVRLKENGGLGNALAIGLTKCKCEIVARMDSDDISADCRCQEQLHIMGTGNVAIVGSNIVEFESDIANEKAIRSVPETNEEIRQFARRRNPFNHPSVMFRKDAVLKVGNYQDCKGFEDYYLWIRLLNAGYKGYNIQKNLVYMRTDEGMYERRGNASYAWNALKARWKIHRTGYSGLMDFAISGFGQLFVSLIPTSMRRKLYTRILRK